MNAFLSKFMMYYEIKRMYLQGRSVSKISKDVGCNRRTVKKYLSMDDGEFESFLQTQSVRQKVLLAYEDFVHKRLVQFRDTSAAQMHDWLKEAHEDFPRVDPKTIFNFVKWVRHRHNLPYEPAGRDYQPVEETPYGLQAQVDFGEYKLRSGNGKQTKVYFFTLVLSRSRFKYVWFSDRPFTTDLAIQGHEKAFGYIGGMPHEIVYDQDKVFISNENSGDIILTERFRNYVGEQGFKLHFCRKSDPESKGKVENVVGYVKRNFLYNRTFYDLEALNQQAVKWLERTANKLEHGFTKKAPQDELAIERPFLAPFDPLPPATPPLRYHSVRKDNTISWKSNLYSLPLGTYKGRGTQVAVRNEENHLVITDTGNRELCRHIVFLGTGKKIINSNHKRDRHIGLDGFIEELCRSSGSSENLLRFVSLIRDDKPRYLRDQLIILKQTVDDVEEKAVARALAFCIDQGISSANDLRILAMKYHNAGILPEEIMLPSLNPLSGSLPHQALLQPQVSSIDDYQYILTHSNASKK
ncbi:IS21 family transposase [Olivibacter sp. XZL3]|uniref:IS21 family transposase n=1 Tax=Olivibacter sp. XZL3 TaxID=1735116 RepID=UPI0010649A47